MRRFTFPVLACFALLAANADAAPKKKPAGAESSAASFDREAASSALVAIADGSLQKCKATNAPKGDGHLTITFAPSGQATGAVVDKGPWVGTPVAKCMQREFARATVPPFSGDPVKVGKSFHFE